MDISEHDRDDKGESRIIEKKKGAQAASFYQKA